MTASHRAHFHTNPEDHQRGREKACFFKKIIPFRKRGIWGKREREWFLLDAVVHAFSCSSPEPACSRSLKSSPILATLLSHWHARELVLVVVVGSNSLTPLSISIAMATTTIAVAMNDLALSPRLDLAIEMNRFNLVLLSFALLCFALCWRWPAEGKVSNDEPYD